MNKKELALKVVDLLGDEHPDPKTELVYENEMQLAVAVALSAQTTDKKVNEIGEGLFIKYKTWKDFATADLEELRSAIRGVNFHKGKADRLIKMACIVLEDFGGKLPHDVKSLMKLSGIAKKSANVIQQELWNIAEGIVVDTHVTRVSNRLGLTEESSAIKIERDLMGVFPEDSWRNISGALVLHGRYVCTAIRKPSCDKCVLNKICPSAFKFE